SSAPPTILTDGDPQVEEALLSGHYLHAASKPLRMRDGSTLGGKYGVKGAPGEFRGEVFTEGAYTAYRVKQTVDASAPPGLRARPPVVSHLRGLLPAPLYPD